MLNILKELFTLKFEDNVFAYPEENFECMIYDFSKPLSMMVSKDLDYILKQVSDVLRPRMDCIELLKSKGFITAEGSEITSVKMKFKGSNVSFDWYYGKLMKDDAELLKDNAKELAKVMYDSLIPEERLGVDSCVRDYEKDRDILIHRVRDWNRGQVWLTYDDSPKTTFIENKVFRRVGDSIGFVVFGKEVYYYAKFDGTKVIGRLIENEEKRLDGLLSAVGRMV